jgi:hypothetical protein
MTGTSEGTHDNGAPGSKTPTKSAPRPGVEMGNKTIDTQIAVNQSRRIPFWEFQHIQKRFGGI